MKALIVFLALSSAACSVHQGGSVEEKTNPAIYFEIPVTDMSRAMAFYERVFGFDFELEAIHGNQMAMMPFVANGPGISGASYVAEIEDSEGNRIALMEPLP